MNLKVQEYVYMLMCFHLDLRVLYTEDHSYSRKIMKELLKREQMDVELALNGEQGLEIFQSHREGYFNILIIDLRLPKIR